MIFSLLTRQTQSSTPSLLLLSNEMIAAVACGHTIGGIHRVNNPTITSTANQGFDLTRTIFDNGVAVDYRDGALTNPLAQPYNVNLPATSSDSRIFGSDGNVTLNRYAASQVCSQVSIRTSRSTRRADWSSPFPPLSQDDFFTDCVAVFSRMLNDGERISGPSSHSSLICSRADI